MSFQIAALAGTAILSAASQVASGAAQARSMRGQAAQYRQMAEESKVQTLQDEVARRRKFQELTGTNIADAAARGITSDSGSYEAIEAENRREAELDMANVRFIGDARTRRYGLASHMSNQAAGDALTSSYIGAGASILGGAWRYYSGMSGAAPTQQYAGDRSGGFDSPGLRGLEYRG